MTTVNVAQLIGPALDWAVAKAEGMIEDVCTWLYEATVEEVADSDGWRPSTKWGQGGPIMEKAQISVLCEPSALYPDDARWKAAVPASDEPVYYYGPTPMIAAMRCVVASKLGDEVELPGAPSPTWWDRPSGLAVPPAGG